MPGEMNKPGWDALPCLLFVVGPAILIYYAALLMLQSGILLASTRLNDAVTLLALVFANLSLISGAYPGWNALSSRKLRATMADLRQSGEEVVLYYGPLEARAYACKIMASPTVGSSGAMSSLAHAHWSSGYST